MLLELADFDLKQVLEFLKGQQGGGHRALLMGGGAIPPVCGGRERGGGGPTTLASALANCAAPSPLNNMQPATTAPRGVVVNCSLDTLIDLWIQCVLGVIAIHNQGVVHFDLKPANFLCIQEGGSGCDRTTTDPQYQPGERLRLKLADFGIAAQQQGTHVSRFGPMGTVVYMAPETIYQVGRWGVLNRSPRARRGDVELGVILCCILEEVLAVNKYDIEDPSSTDISDIHDGAGGVPASSTQAELQLCLSQFQSVESSVFSPFSVLGAADGMIPTTFKQTLQTLVEEDEFSDML